MHRHQPILLIIRCFAFLWLSGCKEEESPVSAKQEDWTVTVTVTTLDEFNIRAVPSGTMNLTLSSKDRTLHAVLHNGNSAYTFNNLPYEKYLVTIQKEGYYLAQRASWSNYYRSISMDAVLYPLPNPMTRIDSIRSTVNTTVPQISLRLFTPQSLPAGGLRRAVVFAGLGSDVSPRYGTYVAAVEILQQNSGISYFQTEDIYGDLRAGGLSPGTKVYLTARVMTGATSSWSDEATGILVYTNLEENTRVVSTIVMP